MAKLMTEVAEGELRRAIQAIEQVSSTEVVIAVRPQLHAVACALFVADEAICRR